MADSSVRLSRLLDDYTRLSALFSGHPFISVKSTINDPPDKYRISYRLMGLEKAGLEVRVRKLHELEIELPSEYPYQPPICRMVTPVFHPNITPQVVCIFDPWVEESSLADIIVRIGEMLTFQSYNTKIALNAEAARWVQDHVALVPLTEDNIGYDQNRADAADETADFAVATIAAKEGQPGRTESPATAEKKSAGAILTAAVEPVVVVTDDTSSFVSRLRLSSRPGICFACIRPVTAANVPGSRICPQCGAFYCGTCIGSMVDRKEREVCTACGTTLGLYAASASQSAASKPAPIHFEREPSSQTTSFQYVVPSSLLTPVPGTVVLSTKVEAPTSITAAPVSIPASAASSRPIREMPDSGKICPKCGLQNDTQEFRCISCHTKLGNVIPGGKERSRRLVVLVLVGAVLVVVGGIFFIALNGNVPALQTNSSSTANTVASNPADSQTLGHGNGSSLPLGTKRSSSGWKEVSGVGVTSSSLHPIQDNQTTNATADLQRVLEAQDMVRDAEIASAKGDFESARQKYRKALESDPNNTAAMTGLDKIAGLTNGADTKSESPQAPASPDSLSGTPVSDNKPE